MLVVVRAVYANIGRSYYNFYKDEMCQIVNPLEYRTTAPEFVVFRATDDSP